MKRFHLTFAALLLASLPALAQQSPPATSADIAAQTRTLHNDAYAYSREMIAAQKAGDAATGTKLDTLHSDLAAIAAALKAGTSIPATSGGTTTAPASTVNYFPARPGDAPFPSPENSRTVRVGNEVQGAPYVLDDTGAIFVIVPWVKGSGFMGITRNGRALPLDPNDSGDNSAAMAIVRGGKVYVGLKGGQITKFNDGMGGFYLADLPPAQTPESIAAAAAAANAPFANPALPTPSPVPPGTSGRVLQVCATCAYTTITAAINATADGDTVDIAGNYHEGLPALEHSILMRSTKGAALDFTDVALAGGGLGGIVPRKDLVVDGLTLTGAGIHETSAGGTGCVRAGASVYITVRNAIVRGCQNGLSSGGFGSVWDISDTTFDANGLNDGYTHNVYFSEGTLMVTATRVTSTNARAGHEWKSRAVVNVIKDSKFAGAKPGVNADDSSVLDFPNGGLVTITGTTITKQPGAWNHTLIGYAMENSNNKLPGLTMTGGALVGLCDSPLVAGREGSTLTFNNVANDNKVKVSGAKAVGL